MRIGSGKRARLLLSMSAALLTACTEQPAVDGKVSAPVNDSVAASDALAGCVKDESGAPVSNVQVTYAQPAGAPGADVVTVFTGGDGCYQLPGDYSKLKSAVPDLTIRALMHETARADGLDFTLRKRSNQADVAPASAWLASIDDRLKQSDFVLGCVNCHQVPAPEVRAFAASIPAEGVADHASVRRKTWSDMVGYMKALFAWEFGRGAETGAEAPEPDGVYSVNVDDALIDSLMEHMVGPMDTLSGYDWGAPVIATKRTAIWEYEVPEPNAVREALLLGDPARLWIADVAANRIVAINVATGARQDWEVPSSKLMGPHSLHRGADGSLWVTPLFNGIVARLNPTTGKWRTWSLVTEDGRVAGIHDLSFGWEHVLTPDKDGRIWFSDIGQTGVGYFDPASGETHIYDAPQIEDRPPPYSLYGFAMTKDRDEVWYSQLDNGLIGGFDLETREFIGPFKLDDRNSGPRRMTITEDDVLYIALYGSGQLAEFDTKTRKLAGIYDLPDTASAPYSATWDPVRKAVWIPTSNGDVIYKFDTATKTFGVLPLPRQRAFLRMVDVDPRTGVLVTSYANILEMVKGPRMAVIVDPGDGAYPERFAPETATAPTPPS